MTIPTVHSPRLLLRPFTKADIAPLHRLLTQDDLLRYFPNPAPPSWERVETIVQRQIGQWQMYRLGWWAVEMRIKPGLIGWNGLQYLPETDEVEIGYLLAKPYWGQGLATEGGKVGLRFGFEELGLEEIIGLTHPQNRASQRVLEKLGMTLTGEAEYFEMRVFRYALEAKDYKLNPQT